MELTQRLEETLGNNWESDVLLPTQYTDFLRRRHELDGEQRLLVAVLDDAVQCYLKNMTTRNRHHRLIFNEARYWMMSKSRQGLFAYENLCEALDVDADALRSELERRRREAEESGGANAASARVVSRSAAKAASSGSR